MIDYFGQGFKSPQLHQIYPRPEDIDQTDCLVILGFFIWKKREKIDHILVAFFIEIALLIV